LPDVNGQLYSLANFASSEALVIMFICNHCPYVQAVESRLIQLAKDLKSANVACVGICANDPTDYPEDAPAALRQRWIERGYGFPYLVDAAQDVAKAYGAVCTPDFFVYDQQRVLRYRGRLDDSWRKPEQVQKFELHEAVMQILRGLPIAEPQNPAMGCSIKWKSL
jgi:thiol-disulfide isomerase/thioredoxin